MTGRLHKNYLFRRIIAFLVIVTFVSGNSFFIPSAAAEVSQPAPQKRLPENLTQIALPEELGKIQEIYQGAAKQTVILLQDAHAIPDAQRNIAKIIEHFQRQYGLDAVGVEGSASKLDPQIFRSFPDKEILKKTFDEYFEKGELTGAAAAAIFSAAPLRAGFYGVEDWPLYEEGLKIYLQASEKSQELIRKINSQKEALSKQKETVYAKELLEINRELERFYKDPAHFAVVLKKLAALKSPEAGGDLARMLDEMKKEEALPSVDQRPEALRRQREQLKRIQGIEGAKVFREFDAYTQSIKEQLFQNEEERKLDRESRHLDLAAKLINLELSREEWASLISQPSFGPLQNDLEPHLAFYRNAEKRDEAFYRNIRKILSKEPVDSSFLLVAGGFHTEGMIRQLKADQISYISVMPAIKALPEHSLYREHMQGQVSWKKYFRVENGSIDLYSAFVRAARDKMLHQVPSATGQEKTPGAWSLAHGAFLKSWRDQIILDLVKTEKIANAGEYTRYLDEVSTKESRLEWQKKLEKFIEGLRDLDAGGRLTQANVLQLFNAPRAAMQAYAPANAIAHQRITDPSYFLAKGAAPIVRRSEMRSALKWIYASVVLFGLAGYFANPEQFFAQEQKPAVEKIKKGKEAEALRADFPAINFRPGFDELESIQPDAAVELAKHIRKAFAFLKERRPGLLRKWEERKADEKAEFYIRDFFFLEDFFLGFNDFTSEPTEQSMTFKAVLTEDLWKSIVVFLATYDRLSTEEQAIWARLTKEPARINARIRVRVMDQIYKGKLQLNISPDEEKDIVAREKRESLARFREYILHYLGVNIGLSTPDPQMERFVRLYFESEIKPSDFPEPIPGWVWLAIGGAETIWLTLFGIKWLNRPKKQLSEPRSEMRTEMLVQNLHMSQKFLIQGTGIEISMLNLRDGVILGIDAPADLPIEPLSQETVLFLRETPPLAAGQAVTIGDYIVTITRADKQSADLQVSAPHEFTLLRSEVRTEEPAAPNPKKWGGWKTWFAIGIAALGLIIGGIFYGPSIFNPVNPPEKKLTQAEEEALFKKAQDSRRDMEGFINGYLERRKLKVVNQAWLKGFAPWYVKPRVEGSKANTTRPFREFEAEVREKTELWIQQGILVRTVEEPPQAKDVVTNPDTVRFLQDHFIGLGNYLSEGMGVHGPTGAPRDHIRVNEKGDIIGTGDYSSPAKDGVYLPALLHIHQKNPMALRIRMTPEKALDRMHAALKSLDTFQKNYEGKEVYGGLLPWQRYLADGTRRLTKYDKRDMIPTLDNGQLTLGGLVVLAGEFSDAPEGSKEREIGDLAQQILNRQSYKKFVDPETGRLFDEWDFGLKQGLNKDGHTLLWTEWAIPNLYAYLNGDITEKGWLSLPHNTFVWQSPKGELDMPQMYLFGAPEDWIVQYLPKTIMKTKLAPLYRNVVYLNAQWAIDTNTPGFPGVEYRADGIYAASAPEMQGIRLLGKADSNPMATAYGTAFKAAVHAPAVEWYRYYAEQRGMQTRFGPPVSFVRGLKGSPKSGPAPFFTGDGLSAFNALAERSWMNSGQRGGANDAIIKYFARKWSVTPEAAEQRIIDAFNLHADDILQKLGRKEFRGIDPKDIPGPPAKRDYSTAQFVPAEKMIQVSGRLKLGDWHASNVATPEKYADWGRPGQAWVAKDGEMIGGYSLEKADGKNFAFIGTYLNPSVPVIGYHSISFWVPAGLTNERWQIEIKNGNREIASRVEVITSNAVYLSKDKQWKRVVVRFSPMQLAVTENLQMDYLAISTNLTITEGRLKGMFHLKDFRLHHEPMDIIDKELSEGPSNLLPPLKKQSRLGLPGSERSEMRAKINRAQQYALWLREKRVSIAKIEETMAGAAGQRKLFIGLAIGSFLAAVVSPFIIPFLQIGVLVATLFGTAAAILGRKIYQMGENHQKHEKDLARVRKEEEGLRKEIFGWWNERKAVPLNESFLRELEKKGDETSYYTSKKRQLKEILQYAPEEMSRAAKQQADKLLEWIFLTAASHLDSKNVSADLKGLSYTILAESDGPQDEELGGRIDSYMDHYYPDRFGPAPKSEMRAAHNHGDFLDNALFSLIHSFNLNNLDQEILATGIVPEISQKLSLVERRLETLYANNKGKPVLTFRGEQSLARSFEIYLYSKKEKNLTDPYVIDIPGSAFVLEVKVNHRRDLPDLQGTGSHSLREQIRFLTILNRLTGEGKQDDFVKWTGLDPRYFKALRQVREEYRNEAKGQGRGDNDQLILPQAGPNPAVTFQMFIDRLQKGLEQNGLGQDVQNVLQALKEKIYQFANLNDLQHELLIHAMQRDKVSREDALILLFLQQTNVGLVSEEVAKGIKENTRFMSLGEYSYGFQYNPGRAKRGGLFPVEKIGRDPETVLSRPYVRDFYPSQRYLPDRGEGGIFYRDQANPFPTQLGSINSVHDDIEEQAVTIEDLEHQLESVRYYTPAGEGSAFLKFFNAPFSGFSIPHLHYQGFLRRERKPTNFERAIAIPGALAEVGGQGKNVRIYRLNEDIFKDKPRFPLRSTLVIEGEKASETAEAVIQVLRRANADNTLPINAKSKFTYNLVLSDTGDKFRVYIFVKKIVLDPLDPAILLEPEVVVFSPEAGQKDQVAALTAAIEDAKTRKDRKAYAALVQKGFQQGGILFAGRPAGVELLDTLIFGHPDQAQAYQKLVANPDLQRHVIDELFTAIEYPDFERLIQDIRSEARADQEWLSREGLLAKIKELGVRADGLAILRLLTEQIEFKAPHGSKIILNDYLSEEMTGMSRVDLMSSQIKFESTYVQNNLRFIQALQSAYEQDGRLTREEVMEALTQGFRKLSRDELETQIEQFRAKKDASGLFRFLRLQAGLRRGDIQLPKSKLFFPATLRRAFRQIAKVYDNEEPRRLAIGRAAEVLEEALTWGGLMREPKKRSETRSITTLPYEPIGIKNPFKEDVRLSGELGIKKLLESDMTEEMAYRLTAHPRSIAPADHVFILKRQGKIITLSSREIATHPDDFFILSRHDQLQYIALSKMSPQERKLFEDQKVKLPEKTEKDFADALRSVQAPIQKTPAAAKPQVSIPQDITPEEFPAVFAEAKAAQKTNTPVSVTVIRIITRSDQGRGEWIVGYEVNFKGITGFVPFGQGPSAQYQTNLELEDRKREMEGKKFLAVPWNLENENRPVFSIKEAENLRAKARKNTAPAPTPSSAAPAKEQAPVVQQAQKPSAMDELLRKFGAPEKKKKDKRSEMRQTFLFNFDEGDVFTVGDSEIKIHWVFHGTKNGKDMIQVRPKFPLDGRKLWAMTLDRYQEKEKGANLPPHGMKVNNFFYPDALLFSEGEVLLIGEGRNKTHYNSNVLARIEIQEVSPLSGEKHGGSGRLKITTEETVIKNRASENVEKTTKLLFQNVDFLRVFAQAEALFVSGVSEDLAKKLLDDLKNKGILTDKDRVLSFSQLVKQTKEAGRIEIERGGGIFVYGYTPFQDGEYTQEEALAAIRLLRTAWQKFSDADRVKVMIFGAEKHASDQFDPQVQSTADFPLYNFGKFIHYQRHKASKYNPDWKIHSRSEMRTDSEDIQFVRQVANLEPGLIFEDLTLEMIQTALTHLATSIEDRPAEQLGVIPDLKSISSQKSNIKFFQAFKGGKELPADEVVVLLAFTPAQFFKEALLSVLAFEDKTETKLLNPEFVRWLREYLLRDFSDAALEEELLFRDAPPLPEEKVKEMTAQIYKQTDEENKKKIILALELLAHQKKGAAEPIKITPEAILAILEEENPNIWDWLVRESIAEFNLDPKQTVSFVPVEGEEDIYRIAPRSEVRLAAIKEVAAGIVRGFQETAAEPDMVFQNRAAQVIVEVGVPKIITELYAAEAEAIQTAKAKEDQGIANSITALETLQQPVVIDYMISPRDLQRMGKKKSAAILANLLQAAHDAVAAKMQVIVRITVPAEVKHQLRLKDHNRRDRAQFKKLGRTITFFNPELPGYQTHLTASATITVADSAKVKGQVLLSDKFGDEQAVRYKGREGTQAASRLFAAALLQAAESLSKKTFDSLVPAENQANAFRVASQNALYSMGSVVRVMAQIRASLRIQQAA